LIGFQIGMKNIQINVQDEGDLCGSVLIKVRTYDTSKSSIAPGLKPNCVIFVVVTFIFESGEIVEQSLWTNVAGSSIAATVAVHVPLYAVMLCLIKED